MAKRIDTDTEDSDSTDSAAIRKLRIDFIANVESINRQVNRLLSIGDHTHSYKDLLRHHASFLLICGTYSISNIEDHEREILISLNLLEKEARAASDTAYAKSFSITRYTPRDIAADRIVTAVEDVRTTIAMLLHLHRGQNSGRPSAPEVPDQIPAPIRVEVNNNSLNLTISQTYTGTISAASLDKIRAAIQELLDKTIKQVGSSSNIDPRLAPNLIGLNSYLCIGMEAMPIEALGLNYQFARRSFIATKETIPELLVEQIDQVLSTVNVILNQYEEWRLYQFAETTFSLPPGAMEGVVKNSEEIAVFLEENRDFVEPKLIDRLKEMTDAYSQGLVSIESVAVPLLESLGNIFSEISRFVINFSPAVGDAVSTPGAAILFIGFAGQALEKFAPTLSNFPPLSYLIDVQKFAYKQFSMLKDSLSSFTKTI